MILKNIFFVLFFLFVHSCLAQESMMSDISPEFMEKLVVAAKSNYPKAKTFDHSIKIAKMNIQKAQLDWLNIVSFIYLYSPTNTADPGVARNSILSGFQAGFSLSIGTILQKPGIVKASREELEIVRLGKDEYFLNIESTVQQRYYLYIQQQYLLNWKAKDLQNAENTLKDIKYKFEKGEESFENYNKAQSTYSSAVQAKIQAESAFLIAKCNLEEIIGEKLERLQ